MLAPSPVSPMDETGVTVFAYEGEVAVVNRWAQPLAKLAKTAKNVIWTTRLMFITFI